MKLATCTSQPDLRIIQIVPSLCQKMRGVALGPAKNLWLCTNQAEGKCASKHKHNPQTGSEKHFEMFDDIMLIKRIAKIKKTLISYFKKQSYRKIPDRFGEPLTAAFA